MRNSKDTRASKKQAEGKTKIQPCSVLPAVTAAQPIMSGTIVGCAEHVGISGMPEEEFAPAAWSDERHDIAERAQVLAYAANAAARLSRSGSNVRITIFSGRNLLNPIEDRQRALSISMGSFSYPSAAIAVIDNIAWLPVGHNIPHEELASCIRAEVEHLSCGKFTCGQKTSVAAVDEDGQDSQWLVFLWPVEAYGFTPESGARFLSESAFGLAATMPPTLPEP